MKVAPLDPKGLSRLEPQEGLTALGPFEVWELQRCVWVPHIWGWKAGGSPLSGAPGNADSTRPALPLGTQQFPFPAAAMSKALLHLLCWA